MLLRTLTLAFFCAGRAAASGGGGVLDGFKSADVCSDSSYAAFAAKEVATFIAKCYPEGERGPWADPQFEDVWVSWNCNCYGDDNCDLHHGNSSSYSNEETKAKCPNGDKENMETFSTEKQTCRDGCADATKELIYNTCYWRFVHLSEDSTSGNQIWVEGAISKCTDIQWGYLLLLAFSSLAATSVLLAIVGFGFQEFDKLTVGRKARKAQRLQELKPLAEGVEGDSMASMGGARE